MRVHRNTRSICNLAIPHRKHRLHQKDITLSITIVDLDNSDLLLRIPLLGPLSHRCAKINQT